MVRVKHRYILLSVCTGNSQRLSASSEDLFQSVKALSNSMLGEWEYADIFPNFQVAEYYPYAKLAILRVPTPGVPSLLRVLKAVRSVKECPCTLEVEKVTGMIRKAKKWIVERR
ncbi:ribonuclease P/MRP protein subunit POP5 [Nematocida sp. AWRm77]|nr:ribonuclease P/MRP protein subunit POP5 [Nematocida sp. AWRm77]